MGARPPSLELAVELMSRDYRLLRCPILVKGDDVLPVVIETDATVVPPAVFQFLGIEVAAKKPAAAHARQKPAASEKRAASEKPAAPEKSAVSERAAAPENSE